MKSNKWVDSILKEVGENVVEREVRRGEKLLDVGEVCDYVGLLEQGSMRMFYINEQGQDISFSFYLAGDVFTNYEGVVNGSPSNMIIECLSACKVKLIHRAHLFALYNSSIYWQEVGRHMADAIFVEAKRRIDFLLFHTPEKRYVELIAHQPNVLKSIPQKYIASYIGVKPQSLSRIRKRIIS